MGTIVLPRPEVQSGLVDLHKLAACLKSLRCDVCARQGDLTIGTVVTVCGVLCLSRCRSCAGSGRLPKLTNARALSLSMRHCAHLGIDYDTMVAVLARAI